MAVSPAAAQPPGEVGAAEAGPVEGDGVGRPAIAQREWVVAGRLTLGLPQPPGLAVSVIRSGWLSVEVGGGWFGVGDGGSWGLHAKAGFPWLLLDGSGASARGWRLTLVTAGGYAFLHREQRPDGRLAYQDRHSATLTAELDLTYLGESGGLSLRVAAGPMLLLALSERVDPLRDYPEERWSPWLALEVGYSFR